MKYVIIQTIDNPYIYDDEVKILDETFDSQEAAQEYVESVLIPATEKKYAEQYPYLEGCQIKSAFNRTVNDGFVDVSYDKLLSGVQIEPVRVETTLFKIEAISEDKGIPEEARSSADYVLNVGDDAENLEPIDAFLTTESAKIVADHYARLGKLAEVVYMPEDDVDVNEIVYRTWTGGSK